MELEASNPRVSRHAGAVDNIDQYRPPQAYSGVSLEEASVLAPLRYTGIIWGVLFGFLFWGDLPDRWVIVGAVVVIMSGVYIYWRKRKRSSCNLHQCE